MADETRVQLEPTPFVRAVFDALDRGADLQPAVDALRRAEAACGLWILDDEDAEPGDGVFVPRDGEPLPETRLRETTRSWERFDRTFETEPDARTLERLRRHVWPFLDETSLLLGGVDFAPDHLLVFDDGAVGSWTAASWGRVLAEWARARRWAGRDDWHPDHFAGSLEGLVEGYPRWREVARRAIERARTG